ncbi:MAG: cell division protein [Caulobacteraceae bacterium]|nr:cell division protein [Caulobacter sp.]
MNPVRALLNRRWRGVRVVNLAAVACLAVLVLGVYAFKAGAGRETARISDVDAQIADERRHVRLLRAELAHLEQPARLARLSGAYLGMAPSGGAHEAQVDSLSEVARAAPPPLPPKPPSPAP